MGNWKDGAGTDQDTASGMEFEVSTAQPSRGALRRVTEGSLELGERARLGSELGGIVSSPESG